MKKSFLLIFCTLLLANFLYAQPNLSGKKIYVNPGHGSWGFNDRPQSTIPYPFKYTWNTYNHIPDTTGFFETNTNLWKCLYLGEKLQEYGATVTYSHTKAGPDPYKYITGSTMDWDGYKADPEYYTYNRPLFSDEIPGTNPLSKDVGNNFSDYDYFISVHSNAQLKTDDPMANYPMFLYRGYDGGDSNPKNTATATRIPYNKNSHEMAVAAWRHAYELIEGISSLRHPTIGATPSVDNMLIYGDRDYYSWNDTVIADTIVNTFGGKDYPSYLGAICHMVPGFVVEGYHHTYGPARHRALNKDYCKMEGLAYFRGILDYFGLEGESVGYILGVIKNNNELAPNHKDYRYHPGSHDQWMPCNDAVVVLKQGGRVVDSYQVDTLCNGIFAFFDLKPGVYTLESTHEGLEFSEQVIVKANETTYSRLYPQATPAICAYDLNVTENQDSYTFSFYANSPATAAKIVFYDNSKQKLGEQVISVIKGENEITIPVANIPGTAGQTLSWELDLTGEVIENFSLLHADPTLNIIDGAQIFNAVNTNPLSDKFGYMYAMCRATNSGDDRKYNGIWEFNYEYSKLNNEVYRGGQAFSHPTRIALDNEGYLYMSDWSDGHSGVFIANTADLTQNFTQFFAGTRASNGKFTNGSAATGSSTPGCYIYETQNSTKLYVYDEDVASNGVLVYNIKEGNDETIRQWTTAPSQSHGVAGNSGGNANVWATSKGFFVAHTMLNPTNTAATTAMQFYNNAGTCTFTSSVAPWKTTINACQGAGYAVSKDEKTLILNNGSKQFLVFNITWNGETPTLELVQNYTHNLAAIRQMNWDYAGNLVCSGDDGIHIFSVPTDNNHTVVPARETIECRAALEPVSRRIWAYDLKRTLTREGYLFSFTSTVDAAEAVLVLKDTEGSELKSIALNNVTQGNNEVLLAYDQVHKLADTDITWEVTLSAGDVVAQATLQELTSDIDKFYHYFPQDIKVNNNPYSDHFGKVYILNTSNGGGDGLSEHSRGQTAGIYVYDQHLNLENYKKGYLPQGVSATYTVASGFAHQRLHRMAINPVTDEVAFIQSRKGMLWEADPNDLNTIATNVINNKGLNNATSFCYDDAGVIYVFETPVLTDPPTLGTASVYRIINNDKQLFATLTDWEGGNERNSIATDGRGGLWIVSKMAGNTNDGGYFIHLNESGEVDVKATFSSKKGSIVIDHGTITPNDLPTNFRRGHVAYDTRHDVLAIGGGGKVTLYQVAYDAGNAPTLTKWVTTPVIQDESSNIDGIAFDYAGDLYVMSATKERFYKFAVPTQENTCTTPAPKSQKLWANPLILDDTKDNTKLLEESMSKSRNVYVFRTMVPGMYNTLCLPFALGSLAGTCLEGAQALEYANADVINEGEEIYLNFNNVSSLEAGKPYLIEPLESAEVLAFANVSVATITGLGEDKPISGGDICFNGILTPKWLEANDKSILFLVSSNRLAWANADAEMFGMRGYFYVPEGIGKIKGRAYIQVKAPITTDLQQTLSQPSITKFIHNGILYIQRDGAIYTVMGTKVQ